MEHLSTNSNNAFSPSSWDVVVPRELPALLRRSLGQGWVHDQNDEFISVVHARYGSPFRPPRAALAPADVLDLITTELAEQGHLRGTCLPLRWHDETELTVAAVQALDPWLKHRRDVLLRDAFLAQPVVRLSAARDEAGRLLDGCVTAFVNTALVKPISDLSQIPALLDTWIRTLGRLGLHARHLRFRTARTPWRRRQVAGLTIHCEHLGIEIGDLVVLWNVGDDTRLAVDLGAGLERITWARCRRTWATLIHGQLTPVASAEILDALRTVTLLLGQGITPAPRGPGSITRRLLRAVRSETAPLGFSVAVRQYHAYWSRIAPLTTPWHDIDQQIEQEIADRPLTGVAA